MYGLLVYGPPCHSAWDGEGGLNTEQRRYMHTVTYVFTESKRGLDNSPSYFTFMMASFC
jgi:hypothetical protein